MKNNYTPLAAILGACTCLIFYLAEHKKDIDNCKNNSDAKIHKLDSIIVQINKIFNEAQEQKTFKAKDCIINTQGTINSEYCLNINTTRYFYIGYTAFFQDGHIGAGSFFRESNNFPTQKELRLSVYHSLKCKYHISIEDCLITSIYEFRDSSECEKFSLIKGHIPIKKCN